MLSKYLSAVGAFTRHPGRGIVLLRQRITSPLYTNSFYLMGGMVLSALFGFCFWLLGARWSSAEAVGLTSAALASSNLLIALCELGLATALVFFVGADPERAGALVNTIVAAGWLAISVATGLFLLGLPLWSPGLLPLRESGLLVVGYAAFTALNHILALQDAAMLSQGRAQYIFWRNLACNMPSVIILWPLLGLLGDFNGLALAYFLPNIAVGLVAGAFVLPGQFAGYRFFGRLDLGVVKQIAAYGSSNHLGNLLWGIPAYALPLVAVNSLSASETGHFAISWTIANFVLIAPRMISFALFAAAAQDRRGLWASSFQSLMLILALVAPIVLLLWFGGASILGFFGRSYVQVELLRLLLLSIVPFSINSVFFVILRVRNMLRQIIAFSACTALAVLACALAFVPLMGANGLAAGWLAGHSLATLVVATIAARRALSGRRISLSGER